MGGGGFGGLSAPLGPPPGSAPALLQRGRENLTAATHPSDITFLWDVLEAL